MIEIRNLTKSYDNQYIFRNFNLKIPKKTMVAIMGKSGKGKTTLLNIIGLIEDYQSGEVIIDGKSITYDSKDAMMALRYQISYLFQNFALIDTMSVEDNLKIALEYSFLDRKEKETAIKNALEAVGLSGKEKRKIHSLSGGQQQRVAMARVILKDSPIILCDEPTGSLDKENAMMIMKLLMTLKEKGKTIVIVTHDQGIAQLCDDTIQL